MGKFQIIERREEKKKRLYIYIVYKYRILLSYFSQEYTSTKYMAISLDSMELSNSIIVEQNNLQEIINEIVNCLLENGRQSLTKYE